MNSSPNDFLPDLNQLDDIEILDTTAATMPPIRKSVEESIVMAMLNLTDTMLKNGDVVCQRLGITTQQWLIMLHLAGDPNIAYVAENASTRPILASELAERSMCRVQTLRI